MEKEHKPPGTPTPGDTDLIEIHDSKRDGRGLEEEARRRVQERLANSGLEKRAFPRFGSGTTCPKPPEDLPYSSELYFHLEQANALYAAVETMPELAHSPVTQLPVIGRLWRVVRNQVHTLILYYVNRQQAHQVVVQRHLISAVNELVAQNEEQRQRISALEAEIETLRHERQTGRRS